MELTHIITFNLALFVALLSPGPALLYALKVSIGEGRVSGVLAGGGLATMAAAWTLMALLGLQGVFELFPWVYGTVKALGALYLLYVAYQTWVGAGDPVDDSANPGGKAFWGGFLINLANPKSVLFAAAVLVVIFPPGLNLSEKAVIVCNHFMVEIVAYTIFAFALGTEPVRLMYLGAKSKFDRIASLILGGLGLKLLLGRD